MSFFLCVSESPFSLIKPFELRLTCLKGAILCLINRGWCVRFDIILNLRVIVQIILPPSASLLLCRPLGDTEKLLEWHVSENMWHISSYTFHHLVVVRPSSCSRTLTSDRTDRRSRRLNRLFVSGLRISLDVYFLLIPDANQVKPQRGVYRVMQTLSASVSRLHATRCSRAHYSSLSSWCAVKPSSSVIMLQTSGDHHKWPGRPPGERHRLLYVSSPHRRTRIAG